MSFFSNIAGWPLKPLKEVAHLKRGYDLPTQDRSEGAVPIFAANGKNGTHNEAKIKGPGVITGRSGTIGKVHFTDADYWPLNTALYVTDFKGNDPKWVYYMLQAFKLERFVEGAGVPTLNRNLVHDELIPLPPLVEQKRIAAILDKADAIRRKRQQAIQLADDFLRAVFLEMFGDPVTNPKGWEVKPLCDIAEPHKRAIVDGPFGASLKTEEYVSEGIPVIRINNIYERKFVNDNFKYITEEKFLELSRSSVNKNDLLIARVGHTIGKACVFDQDFKALLSTTGVCKVTCNADKIHFKFLEALWANSSFQSYIKCFVKGAGQPYFNLTTIKAFDVITPPIELQKRYVELSESLSKSKCFIENSITNAELLFNSISQKAFSGQL